MRSILDVNGVGYEVIVPPIVAQEIEATCQQEQALRLYVSAQSGRDQPWPILFGFLRPREKAFWELLKSIPRVGGKGAARAMSVPIEHIAEAIQEGNKAFLDGLPGVTVDGAEKMIASLRKKVGPFVEVREQRVAPARRRTEADDVLDDAVALLVVMGVKRPDAQRGVEQLLKAPRGHHQRAGCHHRILPPAARQYAAARRVDSTAHGSQHPDSGLSRATTRNGCSARCGRAVWASSSARTPSASGWPSPSKPPDSGTRRSTICC